MLLIYFWVAYFISHFTGCHAITSENLPLDSIYMSEALLHPREGLFIPQIFLHAEKLCNEQIKKLLSALKEGHDILKLLNDCNQTVIETRGKLNFQNETTINTLCSETKMRTWDTCGSYVSLGVNKCFEAYHLPPSKGYNSWQFTKRFTQIFCNEPQHFKERLLDGDNLVCSDPEKIKEIRECNNITFEYFDADGETDLNDLCTNFGIAEYCFSIIFSDECPYSSAITKLIHLLKNQLGCENFPVDKNATIYVKKIKIVPTQSSSKSSLLIPSFGFIVLMTLFT